jgi:hypothetical protein
MLNKNPIQTSQQQAGMNIVLKCAFVLFVLTAAAAPSTAARTKQHTLAPLAAAATAAAAASSHNTAGEKALEKQATAFFTASTSQTAPAATASTGSAASALLAKADNTKATATPATNKAASLLATNSATSTSTAAATAAALDATTRFQAVAATQAATHTHADGKPCSTPGLCDDAPSRGDAKLPVQADIVLPDDPPEGHKSCMPPACGGNLSPPKWVDTRYAYKSEEEIKLERAIDAVANELVVCTAITLSLASHVISCLLLLLALHDSRHVVLTVAFECECCRCVLRLQSACSRVFFRVAFQKRPHRMSLLSFRVFCNSPPRFILHYICYCRRMCVWPSRSRTGLTWLQR